MGNGDLTANLTSDLTLGILPPASVGGAAEERASQRDAQEKSRRRPRPEEEHQQEEESLNEAGSTSEAGDLSPHQLDRLA